MKFILDFQPFEGTDPIEQLRFHLKDVEKDLKRGVRCFDAENIRWEIER
jgi:hypothetical protein